MTKIAQNNDHFNGISIAMGVADDLRNDCGGLVDTLCQPKKINVQFFTKKHRFFVIMWEVYITRLNFF